MIFTRLVLIWQNFFGSINRMLRRRGRGGEGEMGKWERGEFIEFYISLFYRFLAGN